MPIQTLNPATGTVEKEFDAISAEELQERIARSAAAFSSWKQTTLEERAALMKKASDVLKANAERYAHVMATEMGKPVTQGVGEANKCAWNCEHYAEHAATYLTPEQIATEAGESYVQFDPLGPVLLVMPWNFPLWQVFRMAVPVIMAGNTVLLKHASNVPQCALACQEVFEQAGFPPDVFQTLLVGSRDVETILRDDRVVGVSLTGSERAGGIVASIAGSEIKPAVMELGGSDPFIVLDDADIDLTCKTATTARLLNGGQVCISAKRFIVHESRKEEFVEKLKTAFEGYIVGDPMDEKTQMGPMSSEGGLNDILRQVEESVAAGATLVTGGKRIERDGFFFQPAILTDVTPEMAAWKEETFGPIAAVMTFKTDDEAIQLANDSRFALGASLFTTDMDRAKQLIPQIESGMVFVNSMVKTDPRLPTGGVKKSGIGRELGKWGIRAFTNVKTVWIN